MIDYRTGDIVICKDQRHKQLGKKVFEVVSIGRKGSDTFMKVRDVKTGEVHDGWWVKRFELYNVDGAPDCRFCTSECKKESPCGFFQSTRIEIT